MRLVELAAAEAGGAVAVINDAAAWYATFLPAHEWQPPEMTIDQWHQESLRMRWFGALRGEMLCAVMGLEPKLDAALVRHAYVAPACQRQGIGAALLNHVERQAPAGTTQLIAGTYARNTPARTLFSGHGYLLSEDSAAVLRRYYDIPEDRLRTSVTLIKRWPSTASMPSGASPAAPPATPA